jgi:hypothetical protein
MVQAHSCPMQNWQPSLAAAARPRSLAIADVIERNGLLPGTRQPPQQPAHLADVTSAVACRQLRLASARREHRGHARGALHRGRSARPPLDPNQHRWAAHAGPARARSGSPGLDAEPDPGARINRELETRSNCATEGPAAIRVQGFSYNSYHELDGHGLIDCLTRFPLHESMSRY